MLSTLSEEQAREVWRFRAPLGMCSANTEFNRATKPPRGGMQFDMIIDPSEEKWQAGKTKPGTGAFRTNSFGYCRESETDA
ncbi:hypothetical protein HUU39_02550 [candidate division KSB1 bacterium]|nr:hypothetical protein [bacterium]NUM64145.1 hypothetical protein [candidate division KSB1 bacterium]